MPTKTYNYQFTLPTSTLTGADTASEALWHHSVNYDLRARDFAFLARLVDLAPEDIRSQIQVQIVHSMCTISGPSEYLSGHPGLEELPDRYEYEDEEVEEGDDIDVTAMSDQQIQIVLENLFA